MVAGWQCGIMVELLLSDNAMRKSLIAIGAALLLVGAGCSGGLATTSSDLAARQAAVQSAVNALVAAGEALDENAVQALVSAPIIDGVTEFGVSGYFEETSAEIDWDASTWSNDNTTVTLTSKDGITLGTWGNNASGEWKASSAFWFE